MRHVDLCVIVTNADPDTLFARLVDFARYPEIAEAVRSVSVQPGPDSSLLADWEVNFRAGILRWQEQDRIHWSERRVSFHQVTGDLAYSAGEWRIDEHANGLVVRFISDFDLGIPSLEPLLGPVAERALRANIEQIIHGLAAELGVQVMTPQAAQSGGVDVTSRPSH